MKTRIVLLNKYTVDTVIYLRFIVRKVICFGVVLSEGNIRTSGLPTIDQHVGNRGEEGKLFVFQSYLGALPTYGKGKVYFHPRDWNRPVK